MIELRTPSRLHFGLLAYSQQAGRQFGGVGLMVNQPDILLRLEPADEFVATGPMADRALVFARRFADRCDQTLNGARIEIARAPRPHTGLGTGTQLGMAVAKALALMIDRDDWGAEELASMVGRGQRSAIGVYGFFTGGLIVEGGKADPTRLSPRLVQQPFCERWRLVLVSQHRLQGISGREEQHAFATIPSIGDETTAKMCRLVLLGLLPALLEQDLECFSQALFELQQLVGSCFAASQGGIYADPLLTSIVQFVRDQGVPGVGQSSWGPTLYVVTANQAMANQLADDIRNKFDLQDHEVSITEADNHGAEVRLGDRVTDLG